MKDQDKLDKIMDTLHRMDITLAKQQVSLDEHIRRTNLLEEYVAEDKEQFLIITRHIGQVKWTATLIAFLIMAGAAWYGVIS